MLKATIVKVSDTMAVGRGKCAFTGKLAYRVGEKFDETVHLQVSHLTKEKVMVTAVTELGELFIQETVQQSNPEHRTYRFPSLAA